MNSLKIQNIVSNKVKAELRLSPLCRMALPVIAGEGLSSRLEA